MKCRFQRRHFDLVNWRPFLPSPLSACVGSSDLAWIAFTFNRKGRREGVETNLIVVFSFNFNKIQNFSLFSTLNWGLHHIYRIFFLYTWTIIGSHYALSIIISLKKYVMCDQIPHYFNQDNARKKFNGFIYKNKQSFYYLHDIYIFTSISSRCMYVS